MRSYTNLHVRSYADTYAQTFTYDAVGNITTLTDSGQTATYHYPTPGADAVRPNAVTTIDHTGGANDTFTYDNTGRLNTRTIGGTQTTFTYNPLGQLNKATTDGADTTMVYDADGQRLIRRTPTTTVLYLGSMELELSGGQVKAKRYYTAPDGADVAIRTTTGLTWLASGLHDSQQLAINATTGAINRERYLPYGQRRGTDDLPFTDHGFLGKVEDPTTGLTYLGARYYDPAIAKFITTDPLLDLSKPQHANPYSYAGNNPIGASDPTGLSVCNQKDYLDNPSGYANCQADQKYCKNRKSTVCRNWKATQARARRVLKNGSQNRYKALMIIQNTLKCPQSISCVYQVTQLLGFNPFLPAEDDTATVIVKTVADAVFGDAIRCSQGDVGSCALFAVGFIPFGKGASLAIKGLERIRKLKYGDEMIAFAKTVGNEATELCSSFLPGTLVLMADGTHKPIEDVKAGDEVLAADPLSGETKAEVVVYHISSRGEKQLVRLGIDIDGSDGGKIATITSTVHHPFWSGDRHRWIEGAAITTGTLLRTSIGDDLAVVQIRHYQKSNQSVHNLVVENFHTYYVEAGSADVLVHNAVPSVVMASVISNDPLLARAAQEAGKSNQ